MSSSESVQSLGDKDVGANPNALGLGRTATRESLETYLETNPGVRKVVSELEEGAGALGPLTEPLDVERVRTRADPKSDYNPDDKWQYPLDIETGLRIVTFLPGDKQNPKNKSKAVKWGWTLLLGFTCFVVALGSAIVTGDMERPGKELGVSEEVVILASVTCFVIGFGVGPLFFAPLSEEIGRQIVYLISGTLGVIFIIPCGLAHNIGTLIIGRLLDGIFFSAPICLIGGSLADFWEANERGVAMAIFSAAPFMGPVCGPIFGGLLADHASTWRWCYWTFLIVTGFNMLMMAIFMPETYAPTILKRRARKLRKLTGDERYRTYEELKVRKLSQICHDSFLRPFVLLSELIVFLITLYMSVIYGLLYMFFLAYPVVYQEGKHWSASMTGVMFIPFGVGVVLATLCAPFINSSYNKMAEPYRQRGEMPPAELRLIPMMVGCWFVPASMFPFAWSSAPHLSWAGPCFSGLGAGFGFTLLYNPANNYIVDSYQHYAASALASKTFVRSIWGACCPLFTIQMYHRLGYEWASSLMAFISLACCAIPFLFYIYGARIRRRSKYAYSPEEEIEAAKIEAS